MNQSILEAAREILLGESSIKGIKYMTGDSNYLKKYESWLNKAIIQDGEIEVTPKNLVWKDGTWKKGTWNDGTWKDGTWENGTWNNGTWNGGKWENGTWKKGTWIDGVWEGGTWENGTWNDGYWYDGIWKKGVWKKGVWKGGKWENGTWKKGLIFSFKHMEYASSSVDPQTFRQHELDTDSFEELKAKVK